MSHGTCLFGRLEEDDGPGGIHDILGINPRLAVEFPGPLSPFSLERIAAALARITVTKGGPYIRGGSPINHYVRGPDLGANTRM